MKNMDKSRFMKDYMTAYLEEQGEAKVLEGNVRHIQLADSLGLLKNPEKEKSSLLKKLAPWAVGLGGALYLLFSTGCATPEARARISKDPYSHMSLEDRGKVEPPGSPYSNRQKVPFWFPPF